MTRFYVSMENAPAELRAGLEAVSMVVPLDFVNPGLPEITFASGGDGVAVKAEGGKIRIAYKEVNDAFRALGLLNAQGRAWKSIDVSERRRMRKTWVMLDASRNAVLNERSVKSWLVFMALAGINGFMFYTEDTYKVPGEPLFGYMRGAYSEDELRTFDDFAHALGVEMIPCIQALAHMQRILQYDAYAPVKDTASVMLCGDEKTYELIAKTIKAASKPFRSKRIHIGMDEAWDLGRGKYLDLHGKIDGFKIMTTHLARVMEIIRPLGLKPMMWSDMFYRALSATHGYYDTEVKVTKEVIDSIPKDVEQVYWDYYHQDDETYDKMIAKHVEMMGRTPIFAPGAWTWNRFWSAYDYTERTMFTGLKSCLRNGVEEMIVTMWGDDGTECDYFSGLPLLQLASDMIFSGGLDLERTRVNLKGTLGVDYVEWSEGQKIDQPPHMASKAISNISKSLLWENPLQGLYQPQMEGKRLNGFYAGLAKKLGSLVKKPENARLRLPWHIAQVLALKADLPTEILEAYRDGDRKTLKRILSKTAPELITLIQELNRYHRQLWHANHKAFGWEVIESRYGALLGYFENLKCRLKEYLDGDVEQLEELEEPRVKMFNTKVDNPLVLSQWRMASTGHIAH